MKRKVGRPSKADLEARKRAKEKQRILYFILAVGIFLLGGIVTQALNADELVHKFGNPSFSGINQSAHYLTIDEQERTRKEKIRQDVQDALEEAQREAENTVMAKFLRNLQSRIYSTLAKDISESLFNYGNAPPNTPNLSLIHISEPTRPY